MVSPHQRHVSTPAITIAPAMAMCPVPMPGAMGCFYARMYQAAYEMAVARVRAAEVLEGARAYVAAVAASN